MRGKIFWQRQKGMSHSFIKGLSDCKEQNKKKVAEERSADPVVRVREKEVHFVPTVARVSSLIIL